MRGNGGIGELVSSVPRDEYRDDSLSPARPHTTLLFDGESFRLGDGNVPAVLVRDGLIRIGCQAISIEAFRELAKKVLDDGNRVIQWSA